MYQPAACSRAVPVESLPRQGRIACVAGCWRSPSPWCGAGAAVPALATEYRGINDLPDLDLDLASDAVAVAVPLPQTEPSDGPLKALDLFSPACLPGCHCLALALALALCLPVPRPPLLALALALCLLLRASN